MRIINDKIEGDTIINEDTQLNGMIVGKTTVAEGIQLELNGMIVGNVVVEKNSAVYLCGEVVGNVVNEGGRLEVFGIVKGKVLRKDGDTFVDSKAIVRHGLH